MVKQIVRVVYVHVPQSNSSKTTYLSIYVQYGPIMISQELSKASDNSKHVGVYSTVKKMKKELSVCLILYK